MQDRKQTEFKKEKFLHGIWLPAIVILAEVLSIFVALQANAVRCMDEIEQKEAMLSLAMDIRERRNIEISELYGRDPNGCISLDKITCYTKAVTISGAVYADAVKEYKIMEVYRAEAKGNGKYGEFKRIGSADAKKYETFSDDEVFEDIPKESIRQRSTFQYTDSTVTPGKEYAYRVYADGRELDGRTAPRLS